MKKIHYILFMLAVVLTGCWKDYDVEPNPLQVSHAEVYRVGSKLVAGVSFKNHVRSGKFNDMELVYEQNGKSVQNGSYIENNPVYRFADSDTTACVFVLNSADAEKSLRLTELYAISANSRSQNLFLPLGEQRLTFAPSDYQEAPVSVSLEIKVNGWECPWKLTVNSPIRNLIRAHAYIYSKSEKGTTMLHSLSGNDYFNQSGYLDLGAGEYDVYAEVMLYIGDTEVLSLVTPHQTVTIL